MILYSAVEGIGHSTPFGQISQTVRVEAFEEDEAKAD
jgi:hypothetical protein